MHGPLERYRAQGPDGFGDAELVALLHTALESRVEARNRIGGIHAVKVRDACSIRERF